MFGGKCRCLKHGYYHLNQNLADEEEYVLIVDESFNIGRQSLLLILGVKLSDYKFNSSLKMKDTTLLSINVKTSWTAASISEEIEGLKKLGYKMAYACTDGGNNIVKSLKDSNITRIYDCTHALSLLVKKDYEKAERFKSFSSQYALFNRQNYMGQDTAICPPKLRGKCRFLNIYPMAIWSKKYLDWRSGIQDKVRSVAEERIYQKLIWLEGFSDLIEELIQLSTLLKAVFKVLKTEGLSEQSTKKVNKLVSESQAPLFMRTGIRAWLTANSNLLSGYEKLICCSDIIESFFGKFKHEQAKNPSKGITIGCLNLVNFGKQPDKKEVKKAMEEVKIVDLVKWKKEKNLISFNARRQELFEKVG